MPLYPALLLCTPLLGLLVVLAAPPCFLTIVANIALALPVLLCLPYLTHLDMLLSFVTAGLILAASMAGGHTIAARQKLFYGGLLGLEAAAIGTIVATSLLPFVLCWLALPVTLYFLIAPWGNTRSRSSARKMLVSLELGSLLVLLALPYQYGERPWWAWWCFAAGFALRIPLFPLHTWLADALTAAPLGVSAALTGVLMTTGLVRLIVYVEPFLQEPDRASQLGVVALTGIVYCALLSLAQKDWKRLLAHTSMVQTGLAALGIASLRYIGLQGAIVQMVAQALAMGLLFLLFGFLQERRNTTQIAAFGGLFRLMPRFTLCLLVGIFSAFGLPLFAGFSSLFAILQGAASHSFAWAGWAMVGSALLSASLLRLFHNIALGDTLDSNFGLQDLNRRELALCLPFVVALLAIGLYPQPLFDWTAAPVRVLLHRIGF